MRGSGHQPRIAVGKDRCARDRIAQGVDKTLRKTRFRSTHLGRTGGACRLLEASGPRSPNTRSPRSSERARVGWLGGTFDPVHQAILMWECARAALDLDSSVLVCSCTPTPRSAVASRTQAARVTIAAEADGCGVEMTRCGGTSIRWILWTVSKRKA